MPDMHKSMPLLPGLPHNLDSHLISDLGIITGNVFRMRAHVHHFMPHGLKRVIHILSLIENRDGPNRKYFHQSSLSIFSIASSMVNRHSW